MLDTNIVSFFVKRRSLVLRDHIFSQPKNALCISAISYAELMFGLKSKPEATKLAETTQQFLSGIQILPWTNEVAVHYADIRSDLTQKGRIIGALDMLIAAHARSQNLTLITNNTREFERVAGLNIKDWTI